jgi:hypothetical protein
VTFRYRKKPIPVEARQLTPDSLGTIVRRLEPAQFAAAGADETNTVFVNVRTLEGVLTAREGDWIVWGVKGDVWPVRGDIFAETYEPADEQP